MIATLVANNKTEKPTSIKDEGLVDLKEAAKFYEQKLITKEEFSLFAALVVQKMIEENKLLNFEFNQLNNTFLEVWQTLIQKNNQD